MEHPDWCNPAYCTAERHGGHASRVWLSDGNRVAVALMQIAGRETALTITDPDTSVVVNLEQAEAVAGAVGRIAHLALAG